MYFPLLRGKQFELLALREIASIIQDANVVSPLIEPVKLDTRILSKATQALIACNINFNIVLNTNILKKDLDKCMNGLCELIGSELCSYENYQIALNINSEKDFQQIYKYIDDQDLKKNKFSLIHNEQINDLDLINLFNKNYNVQYNIINTNKVNKRYYRNFERNTLVSLDDPFNQQDRNVDYLKKTNEFYSDDFLFYKEEGYIGFGDFLTIGDQYSDSGFTPYAVAIHLTYLDVDKIRIAHFVSDNNNDTNAPFDIPKKYSEAVNKLITFANERNIDTQAVKEFKRLHDHYPGLGTVKKLSIMNHIELMYSLLK